MSPGAPNDPVPFGKYYLLGLIARGGMAEVYRARPKTAERKLFAVKVMRPQLAREARFIDMFHREGKLAMMLRNRCIVETLEIGQHDGRHYIAMEYIGGRDLTQVLRRCQETQQRIPVPHAVYIAARIAEGLHFAHTLQGPDGRSLNIVNRDVSPSNVRMSYDGAQRKERECPGQSQQRPHGSSSFIFRTAIGFPRSHAASGPRRMSELARSNYCGVSPICSMIFW